MRPKSNCKNLVETSSLAEDKAIFCHCRLATHTDRYKPSKTVKGVGSWKAKEGQDDEADLSIVRDGAHKLGYYPSATSLVIE